MVRLPSRQIRVEQYLILTYFLQASSLVSSVSLLSARPDYRSIVELLRVIAFVFVPLALGQRAQGN